MTLKLFVATPIMGAPETEFSTSLLSFAMAAQARGLPVVVKQTMGESLITRARNSLVHSFLKTDCTHLLFIDSDVVFEPDSVFRLVGHGLPIVCGAYPKKRLDWETVRSAALAGETDLARHGSPVVLNLAPSSVADGVVDVVNGVIEVMDAATGFMLVQRDVFIKMANAMPDLLTISDATETRGEPIFGFFLEMVEPETRRHLSEDWAFSRRCQQIGIPVAVDTTIRLGHVGRYKFRGDCEQLFGPDAPVDTQSSVPVATSAPGVPDEDTEFLDVLANPTGRIERLHIERYEIAAQWLKEAGLDETSSIANAACGTNYGAPILRAATLAYVVGFDRNPVVLAIAAKRPETSITVERSIIEGFHSFDGFDALVCIETLEHLDKPWEFLSALRVPNLVLSVPIIPTKHRNPWHKWDFTAKEIEIALVCAGYRLEKSWQQLDDVKMWFATRPYPRR